MLILKLLATYFVVSLEHVYDIIPRRFDVKVGLTQLKLNLYGKLATAYLKK